MNSHQSVQAQVDQVAQFTAWLSGALLFLWVGKTVGGMEKRFLNDALDMVTPEDLPLRIPQTHSLSREEIASIAQEMNDRWEHAVSFDDRDVLSYVRKRYPDLAPSITSSDIRRIRGAVNRLRGYRPDTITQAKSEDAPGAGLHPRSLTIEGDRIPWRDRHLIDPLPLPESALSVERLPAIRVEPGETKTDALLKKLREGVGRIQSSGVFRDYLVAMSRFHQYSWNNQLLIMLQRPDATRVAGFNTWKDLGRWVRKGETGIAIFAPVFSARETMWVRRTDGATWRIQRLDSEWGVYRESRLVDRFETRREAERQLREWGAAEEEAGDAEPRFIVVYVYDISQTEGKPLPEFDAPVLTGETNHELFGNLMALVKQRGVTLSFESRPHLDPGIKGQFTAPNLIWVRPEEPPAQQLKTLLHESAHYYSAGVFRMPRADAETIAESVAFVVGAHYGFDTGARSFPYVALWARDEKTLEQNLSAIRSVANAIIEDLGEHGSVHPEAGGQTPLLPASIPIEDLKRIADKYGWWAARLAEAVCPRNDVACVEREARRLNEARKSRLG